MSRPRKTNQPYRSNVRRPVAVAIAEAEHLADCDCSLTEVCQQLGIKPDSLWSYCKWLDRSDLYIRLANREPDAEQRRATRDGIKRRKEVA